MGWTEDGKITVGERQYIFTVYWNNNLEQECVKIYMDYMDETEYITQFQSVKEMKEFLSSAEPDEVNKQMDMVLKFRRHCKKQLEEWANEKKVHGQMGEDEKGENTKAFMKRLQMLCGDMPVRQFAWILGLNEGTVFNLLRGQRNPGVHIIKRIAEKTGVTTDWLLGRDD